LIALAAERKDIKNRARIPAEIEQRYQLRCEVPQPGSYILPASVESVQPYLASLDQVSSVLGTFESVAEALHSRNRDQVSTLLPDSAIRRRVVDAFQQLAPRPGSGWRLDLSRNGSTVHLDDTWQSSVRKMYVQTETEPDRETVNGELLEINFADRQLTILPIGANRKLTVTYPEDLEDILLENRRELIQITGRVIRDNDDQVKSMFDIESISPLDLSPLELREVAYGDLHLRLKEPVYLQPYLNGDNPQFVNVEDPALGLDVFAGTVSELLDEVAESLVIGWRQYALAPDSELSPKALELKRHLLAAMEPVSVGG
jgi:hypothetical protein